MASIHLRADELARIVATLGREPSTVELHAFDAQWSEHCSYKSSRTFLRRLPTLSDRVVVGVGEDAGIVHLGVHEGERYGVVIAHESHNHPSQIVPFEGAATGVGGIVRDVLCMGAQVVALADALRFGDTSDPRGHQRAVARGVVDGISAYGNAIGVPNIAGDAYSHAGFDENCLVNVIALGIVKESEIVRSRAPIGSAGWDLVLVGKATDPSGFGGASFSSVALEGGAEADKGAVQVPDPFLKNVIMRASYRVFAHLRERGVVAGFKDLGAGGIVGCSAELCAAGGYGATIDLDDVNVAIEGMAPEVIAVGETQERLLWVLPPDITADVLQIYNQEFTLPEIAYNARAVVIGVVSDDKRYVLRHGNEIVMDVDIDFLTGSIHEELPYAADVRPTSSAADGFLTDLTDAFDGEPHYVRYDTAVRGRTVVPRGAGHAGVLCPIPGSRLGVALAVAGDPSIDDAFEAGEYAVREAVRQVVAVGATPIALTDCLNFGNPHDPAQLGALVRAVDGLAAAAGEFRLPFISGNVSLYNVDADGRAIPPSPIVACVGVIDDVANVVYPLESA
ncbi:MAG TPA: phosphoribosylformylglycinamidine synthase subunit PurL [Candidatus Baltobacteraceae bacterium]